MCGKELEESGQPDADQRKEEKTGGENDDKRTGNLYSHPIL